MQTITQPPGDPHLADSSLPLVSILIPSYNAEKWVRQCVASALAQTYPNKEVIVIDDGSEDKSVEVLQSFGDQIQLQTGPNRGGNVTRNSLLKLAAGAWIQYLDADDYLLPGKISGEMEFLKIRSDLDVVYSPFFNRSESDGRDVLLKIPYKDDAIGTYCRWLLNTNALLFRASALRSVGGWKEDQPCCQENELLLRMIKSGCWLGYFPRAGAVHRHYGEGTVSKSNPMKVIRVRTELTDDLAVWAKEQGLWTDAHQQALTASLFEDARSAYRWDRSYAHELMARARAGGPFPSTPAAPMHYRLALKMLGFERTEQLARAWRRIHGHVKTEMRI